MYVLYFIHKYHYAITKTEIPEMIESLYFVIIEHSDKNYVSLLKH